MRLTLLSASLLFAFACGNPQPSSQSFVSGKADGNGACNAQETELLRCVAENCQDLPSDEQEACFFSTCSEFLVIMTEACESCMDEAGDEPGAALDACGGTQPAPPPCEGAEDLVECAQTNCPTETGEALLGCLDENCNEDNLEFSEQCENCVFFKAGLGSSALDECLAPPEEAAACNESEAAEFQLCGAACGDKSGEELSDCLAEACESFIDSGATPPCLFCVGGQAQVGKNLDDSLAVCTGADDTPACGDGELEPLVDCAGEPCAGIIGDPLDACVEDNCSELAPDFASDSCGLCLGIQAAQGADLATMVDSCQ
jgi:hypothetical protein